MLPHYNIIVSPQNQSPIFAMAEIVALYAMGELPQSSDAAGAEDAIRKLLYAKVSS